MSKYTENGSAILCDGETVKTSEILEKLNSFDVLSKQNDEFEAALIKCRNKFELYEHHHLVKGHAEKAKANAEMVEMIRNTLLGK